MKYRIALALGLSLLIAGCAVEQSNRSLAANHPANSSAPESHIDQLPPTLAFADTAATTAPAESRSLAGDAMQPMDHSMLGIQHHHELMATQPAVTPATTQASAKFTCKMHPEVVSEKPGKCPKCTMALVPIRNVKPLGHGGHK